ncbi:Asp-tRNA(Asn)/Glu-tRNA(Gln) amidotransferase subunit GatC [Acuticoccus sp. M5D2P5]|uniref:Asp-tRNA(Asn)/Glu-tRNA(Gln) amidotransferase subunit GatC n=1 Tax=Acuticoccus kalidii TaxID=2910977 RepID=UPI001F424A8C|nr:Asp-tRNA(Asn)/Glu-tRNA(Gln) amidotransferase subunit GatC [Acuticoccus kalidii]MCF3934480.1 Asp-tRNA(Asn)/Glu-tRNA(Gln) amidotransferase subunit GatC [Acuticoccus kalidii]
MSVDLETVRRVAHLARIKVGDDEAERLQGELNAILGFVEQLGEVDVDGVEPMTATVDAALRRRADEVTDGGNPDKVLANAPESDDGFFLVPKVVE